MTLFEHIFDVFEIVREARIVRVCRSMMTIGGGGRIGFIVVVGIGGGGREKVDQRRVCESVLRGSLSELEKKSHGGGFWGFWKLGFRMLDAIQ